MARKTAAKIPPAPVSAAGLSGSRARLSVDDPLTALTSLLTSLNFPEPEQDWRGLSLDDRTLDRIQPSELITRLADLSPEFSKAIWDFLRFTNAGYECEVFIPGTKKQTDDRAKARLEEFFGRLDDLYGSLNVVLNRLFLGAFLRGAFFGELVFDARGRFALDIATPDPLSVKFEGRSDPVRGRVWVPFQWQRSRKVYLDDPKIRYIPLDPLPGQPYGRAMATPAVFSSLFAISFLRDLKRVVAQQGYPRLDIEFATDQIALWAQKLGADQTPQQLKTFALDMIREAKEEYASLQPDDAWVHTNASKLNRPVGTLDNSSLGAVDGIMRALERIQTRSLKSVPFLFALSETTTETQSNRQFEAFIAGIRSVQHLAENVMEYFGRLALQAEGIVAVVEFRFAEVRAAEALRDAQVEELQIRNKLAKYLAGWIDHETAAQEGADVDEPAEAEPLFIPGSFSPFTAEPAAEPEPLGTLPGEEAEETDDQERRVPTNGRRAVGVAA